MLVARHERARDSFLSWGKSQSTVDQGAGTNRKLGQLWLLSDPKRGRASLFLPNHQVRFKESSRRSTSLTQKASVGVDDYSICVIKSRQPSKHLCFDMHYFLSSSDDYLLHVGRTARRSTAHEPGADPIVVPATQQDDSSSSVEAR